MARKPVKGFPSIINSFRDLGREGYRGCSPWARQGIFIQGAGRAGQSETTRESTDKHNAARRPAVENRMQKTEHEFEGAGTFVCLHCCLIEEGHNRLMAKLRGEKVPDAVIVRG